MYDLISFEDSARVWIYSADRKLEGDQIANANEMISDFAKSWVSHNVGLKATGGLMHGVFAVLIVDQEYNNPGGCSIDQSVRFMQELGQKFGVDFLNREYFYYLKNGQLELLHRNELKSAYSEGQIDSDTLFYDTLVQDKLNYQHQWLKPLENSWHRRFLD